MSEATKGEWQEVGAAQRSTAQHRTWGCGAETRAAESVTTLQRAIASPQRPWHTHACKPTFVS